MKPRMGEFIAENRGHSSRLIETDEGWFFRTREGIAVGPYPTEFDAEVCASLHTARLAQLDRSADVRAVIHAFLSDPVAGPRSAQFRPGKVVDAADCRPKSPPPLAIVARVKALFARVAS